MFSCPEIGGEHSAPMIRRPAGLLKKLALIFAPSRGCAHPRWGACSRKRRHSQRRVEDNAPFAAIREAEAGGRKWERSSFEIGGLRIMPEDGPPKQYPPPYESGGSWNRADGATAFLMFGRRSVVVETREAAERRKKWHRPESMIVKRPQF